MIGVLALAAASAIQCHVEDAHYVLRHFPDISAYFRRVESGPDWPGGLALAVHFEKSGRTFWWLPWSGGTDNLQNLASTGDVTAPGWRPPGPDGGPRPFGNREYVGMDADYDVIGDIPRREGRAPAHILIPDAGSSSDPVFVAKELFDLVSCSGDDN